MTEVFYNQPVLHKTVPMGARVITDLPGLALSGTVVGVASLGVIYTYIVALDVPHKVPGIGYVNAIACPGPQLEGEDGQNWRLDIASANKDISNEI